MPVVVKMPRDPNGEPIENTVTFSDPSFPFRVIASAELTDTRNDTMSFIVSQTVPDVDNQQLSITFTAKYTAPQAAEVKKHRLFDPPSAGTLLVTATADVRTPDFPSVQVSYVLE